MSINAFIDYNLELTNDLNPMKLSIIIPTRNRQKLLKRTLLNLSKHVFFFSEIIIVDSSDKNFLIKKNEFKNIWNKIKFYKSIPSISHQRNLGLKNVNKNSNYVMFLDDDVNFEKSALKKMIKFLHNNNDYVGIGFNLVIKDKSFIDKIKKFKLFKMLKVYDERPGIVTKSGWHTKAINLKSNTEVQWLPTQAVIYKKSKLKNIKFESLFGKYSYLEDLDFSYQVNKKGKLIINHDARYSSDNRVDRNFFFFGIKETINRFLFVKKHQLNLLNFNIGLVLMIFKNLIFIFSSNYKYFFRLIGNFLGIILIFFNIKKVNKLID